MKLIVAIAAGIMAAVILPRPILADSTTTAPFIEVSATGSREYVPDIARTNFGVRGVAGTAADAAQLLAQHARTMIDALRRLGIAESDIKTTNYNLYYQEPQPVPMEGAAIGGAKPAIARPVLPPTRPYREPYYGLYIASESIEVKSSVTRAGAVIDTAIRAGADQSYGIGYDSSQRDRLYRLALTQAIASAREQADAMAAAAHVTILGVQSISTGASRPVMYPMMRAMGAAAPVTPVEAGTDTMTATVDVVFRIR